MGEKILCTIDFTEASKHALQWAIAKAQQQKAHLTILYTYRLIKPNHGEVIHMKKKMETEAVQEFAILEKELLSGNGVSYDFRTEIGFVSDRIEDYAKKNHVSFLVMDKSMNTGNKEILDDLIKNINISLVVVP